MRSFKPKFTVKIYIWSLKVNIVILININNFRVDKNYEPKRKFTEYTLWWDDIMTLSSSRVEILQSENAAIHSCYSLEMIDTIYGWRLRISRPLFSVSTNHIAKCHHIDQSHYRLCYGPPSCCEPCCHLGIHLWMLSYFLAKNWWKNWK